MELNDTTNTFCPVIHLEEKGGDTVMNSENFSQHTNAQIISKTKELHPNAGRMQAKILQTYSKKHKRRHVRELQFDRVLWNENGDCKQLPVDAFQVVNFFFFFFLNLPCKSCPSSQHIFICSYMRIPKVKLFVLTSLCKRLMMLNDDTIL